MIAYETIRNKDFVRKDCGSKQHTNYISFYATDMKKFVMMSHLLLCSLKPQLSHQ